MEKGIIYNVFNFLIENLKKINIVEWFKALMRWLISDKRTANRLGVDIFIILKWLLILFLWLNNVSDEYVNFVVFYLIVSNLYTYFYYHSWSKDLGKKLFDLERIKRRYLHLLLAIAFNVFCFAYLIAEPFKGNFNWKDGYSNCFESWMVSLTNSLTSSYPTVQSINSTGNILLTVEVVISFVFLTIILSNSIPQHKEKEEDGV